MADYDIRTTGALLSEGPDLEILGEVALTRDVYLTGPFAAHRIRGPGRIYPRGWPVTAGGSVAGDGWIEAVDKTLP